MYTYNYIDTDTENQPCITNVVDNLKIDSFIRRPKFYQKSAMHNQRCRQSQNRFLQKETKVLEPPKQGIGTVVLYL